MINEIIELTNLLIEKAKVKRSVSAQEGCYLFNELDFLLIKAHSAHTLIGVLNSKIDDFYKEPFNGRFSKSQLSRTLEFLKSANKASKSSAIVSQIQFVIDGKMTPPTEEQVDFVKQYLKRHKIALNEMTYTYALRRLIVGGDINTKFERFNNNARKTLGILVENVPKTVMIYLEKNNQYLMLYRNKKEIDINKGKYIGVGGHVEKNETEDQAVVREVKEETGLDLLSFKMMVIKKNRVDMLSILMGNKRRNPEFTIHYHFVFKTK